VKNSSIKSVKPRPKSIFEVAMLVYPSGNPSFFSRRGINSLIVVVSAPLTRNLYPLTSSVLLNAASTAEARSSLEIG
jgi:hypothetical protein